MAIRSLPYQEFDTQLDFSGFKRLETLKIHKELAFERMGTIEVNSHTSNFESVDRFSGLVGRLPSSLRHLTVSHIDPPFLTTARICEV